MRIFPSYDYFTRRQSDARYLFRPQPALPPTGIVLDSVGLSTPPGGGPATAYVTVSLIPPANPYWSTATQYVTSFIFHAIATGGSDTVFTLPYAGVGPYLLSPLVPGVTYSLAVDTVDYLGQVSVSSVALQITTPTGTNVPEARIIQVDPVVQGAQVTMDALNTEIDFDHYTLYRGLGSAAAYPVMSWTNAQAPGGVVVDQAIPVTATDYYYFVRSYNTSGNYGQSNTVANVSLTATATAPVVAPNLVGATAVAQADGAILFTWLSNTSDTSPNLSGYRVYRQQVGETFWETLAEFSALPALPGSNATTSYRDTIAVTGLSYQYTVTAIDGFGNESAPAAGTPPSATSNDVAALSTPGGPVMFGAGAGAITAAWTPASDAYQYEVSWRFAQVSTDPRLTAWSDPVRTPAAEYVIYGLVDPITGLPITADNLANEFQVQVRAFDREGNTSAYLSGIITLPDLAGYTLPNPSSPPAPLVVSPSLPSDPGVGVDGTLTLNWTAPSTVSISGYQIELLDSANDTWALVDTLTDPTAGNKTYTITGVDPFLLTSETYVARVRTLDASGASSRPNLLTNPGFESGLGSWNVSTSGSAVSANTFNNSAGAAQVDYNAGLHQVVPAIIAGHIYSLSAYLRENPVSPGGQATLRIEWLDVNGTVLRSDQLPALLRATSSYVRYSLSTAAPANSVAAAIWLLGSVLSPSTSVLWDSAQFENNPLPTTYADGKTLAIEAIDTTGPEDYASLSPVASGGLGQINVRWNNPPALEVDYYRSVFEVWRNQSSAAAGDPGWIKIAEVPGANDSEPNGYDDFDPDEDANVTWYYQLAARDRWGNRSAGFLKGAVSSPVLSGSSLTPNDQGILTTDAIPPLEPDMTTALIQVLDDGSITVIWNNQATVDLAGYNIYRRRHQDTLFQPVSMIKVAPGSGTVSWTDTNPVLLTSYDYTVSAFDRAGNESAYDTVNFLTATSTDTRTPAAPTSATGKGGVGLVNFNWVPSATIGVQDYNFRVSFTAGTTWQPTVVVTGSSYTLSLIAAQDISNMVFQVAALSSTHAAASAWVTGTMDTSTYVPVDGGPPLAVTSLSATPNNNSQVVLAWTPSLSLDVNHYQIDLAVQADPTIPPSSSDWAFFQNVPASSTGATLNGLRPYSSSTLSYAFRVTSVDNSSLLSTSNPEVDGVQVLIDTSPPAIPAGFSASAIPDVGDTFVHAVCTWNANSEVDLLQYEVRYYLSDTSFNPLGPESIFAVPRDISSTTINSLQAAPAKYAISVRAVDVNQNRSAFCDPILVSVPASLASGPDPQPGVAAGWTGSHPVITIGTAGSPGTAYTPDAYFLYFQVHRAQMHTVASANRTTDPANPANGQGHIVFTTVHNFSVGQTALLQSFTGHTTFNGLWTIVSVPSNTQIVVEMPGLPSPISTFLNEGHGAGEGLVLVNTGSTSYVDTSVGTSLAGTTFVYSARAYNNGGFLSAASNPFGVLTIP